MKRLKKMKNELWYQKVGFNLNPFSIKPAAFHDNVFGSEANMKEIIKLIENGSFLYITGEYGRGKTSLLKKIINKYRGKNKVAYISGNQISRHLNVDSILVNAGGFFSRFFKIKSEDIMLLLDEVQDIDQNDANDIIEAYEEGYIKSVVLVSAKEDFNKLNKKFNNLVGKNKFEMKEISEADAVKIIRKRIGKLNIISNNMITKIFKLDKNPRTFLKNVEDVCRYVVDNDEKEATDEHIKKVLKNF